MAKFTLTEDLRSEYQNLFSSCEISLTKLSQVDAIADKISANKGRYQSVGDALGVPWFFIGPIHNMESSLNFSTHLHNGDPLTGRTVHVPKGRPKGGTPPFTWEFSATDALKGQGLDQVTDWTLASLLYQMETYNGFGYRTHGINSPYLWSASNNYTKGKYVADGTFDPDAVSSQIGAAVVFRRLAERKLISFDSNGNPVLDEVSPEETVNQLGPLVPYAPTVFSEQALLLQKALNQFTGVFLLPDGFAGPRTSDAFQNVTGHFLNGDPRPEAAAAAAISA